MAVYYLSTFRLKKKNEIESLENDFVTDGQTNRQNDGPTKSDLT